MLFKTLSTYYRNQLLLRGYCKILNLIFKSIEPRNMMLITGKNYWWLPIPLKDFIKSNKLVFAPVTANTRKLEHNYRLLHDFEYVLTFKYKIQTEICMTVDGLICGRKAFTIKCNISLKHVLKGIHHLTVSCISRNLIKISQLGTQNLPHLFQKKKKWSH